MGYCTAWCRTKQDKIYHDTEWGQPVHDDRKQFEYLMLEVMQCGLSWQLILKKREVLRRCFHQFDFNKIAAYTPQDIVRILQEPQMIHSPRKIKAVIQNAQAFLEIRRQFGTFSTFLWEFCGNKTILYNGHAAGKVPAANGLSVRLSQTLKKCGFVFLGPVTLYSHLQACGIINDHSNDCPLLRQINTRYPTIKKKGDQEVF